MSFFMFLCRNMIPFLPHLNRLAIALIDFLFYSFAVADSWGEAHRAPPPTPSPFHDELVYYFRYNL